jgi:metal-sulfur cluster biosynthetic enzyme
MVTKDQIMEAIRPVQDPEVHIGLVDLGLIYGVDLEEEGAKVKITMTLTSPMCPAAPELVALVKIAAEKVEGVGEAIVNMVWEPAWDPKTMASDDAKDILGIW